MVRLRTALPRPVAVPEPFVLRLGVHDSSRVEWVASVKLPEQGNANYQIDFAIEIPANSYSVHNVWDHKQTFTRLKSPSEDGELRIDRGDVDELRRDTLGVSHRLKVLLDRFEQRCKDAATHLGDPPSALWDALGDLLGQAQGLLAEMRRALDRPPSDESRRNVLPEVEKEWVLADEFLSHKLLDFLGAAERAVDEVLCGPCSRVTDPSWGERLREQIAESLAAELSHRGARGYLNPRAESPSELGRFIERASQLKKHFQDVLYLEVEAYMVDLKMRNWTGIVAASLAAAFWLAFTLLPIANDTRAGISLGAFAVIFALTYALKDRIKELTRAWLAGRLVRLYGQRVVTLRLPPRVDPQRPVLMEGRETFDCIPVWRDDVLNEKVGRQRVMELVYSMKSEAHAAQALKKAGIHSVKHVFRYDLSPIFSRLDDAVKSVPVLDPRTNRVRFVDAPKEYRLPVRLVARPERGEAQRLEGQLVVSKRGIERLELGGAAQ